MRSFQDVRSARRVSPRSAAWSPLARFTAAMLLVFLVVDSFLMVKRASHGESDVGMFYQSAFLLNHGSGGEIYDPRGQTFGWFRCIPPAGLAFFQPLAHFSSGEAGLLWGVLNWGMLGASLVMLQRFLGRLDQHRRLYQSIFPWAALLLVLMSLSSIQVGQFSLLFAMCWMGYLLAGTRQRDGWMGLAMALPAAIKIYPAFMLLVSLTAKGKRSFKEIGFFLLGLVLFSAVIPTLFNGARVVELSHAFLHDVVFNKAGRAAEDLNVGVVSNQGLESILLRYFSSDATFQAQFPAIPHFDWPRAEVLRWADEVRLVVFGLTLAVAVRWRLRVQARPIYASLMMAALWSSTMFLIMPGPKARYAIYVFLAFLPLLAEAAAAARQNRRFVAWLRGAFILLCAGLILQFVSNTMRAVGIGFLGAVLLWGANLWCVYSLRAQASIQPLAESSGNDQASRITARIS